MMPASLQTRPPGLLNLRAAGVAKGAAPTWRAREEVRGPREWGPGTEGAGLPLLLHRLELCLIDRLLIGLPPHDLPRIEQLLDGGIHGAHAELPAGLHG